MKATPRNNRSTISHRSGFSMLEMLLALAILGTSLALLAQLADTGTEAAREARALAMSRVLCQTKLSELLLNSEAGQTPTPVVDSPVEAFDSESLTTYTYSVDIAQAPLAGMLAIRVTVRASVPNEDLPLATYVLDRWMIDPALGLVEAEMEEKAAREEIAAAASGEAI
ncbi:prepilin-type N-terminal cleavage/methylation domain-containing protein [Stieleria varia]|uniref:Prepilin-type N-terminal cleavage/methylation domain-containing protein n=1 Tax=Stieleria varia TaxID=2528005 RepID=A0A5C6B5X9_9BACT|nr:prepilin-type N-terminal cleavage/methylation domain-containing protein [Stieleria varia]TWU07685.1 hypothetical protein Pla52n_02580 [Stieleria varia]